MAQTTVRITERTRGTLRALARLQGRTMQDVLERAIEDARRAAFIDATNAGYAALRKDPTAWSEVAEERALWDKSAMDGLRDEPPWPADAATPRRRGRRRR